MEERIIGCIYEQASEAFLRMSGGANGVSALKQKMQIRQ